MCTGSRFILRRWTTYYFDVVIVVTLYELVRALD